MKKRPLKSVLLSVLVCLSGLIRGADLPAVVDFNANGSFKIGEAEFVIQTYNSSWEPSSNSNWGNIKTSRRHDELKVNGTLITGGQSGTVMESIQTLNGNAFELNCALKFVLPTAFNGLFGTLILPLDMPDITVGDKKIVLPRKFEKVAIMQFDKPGEVRLKLSGGLFLTISGASQLSIQDNRKFDNPTFSLRFAFTPQLGIITDSGIKLNFRVDTIKNRPIDIFSIANRGFADEKAGDGRGGWSDQGPENDLRTFKLKKIQLQGLHFDIIDSDLSQNRSVAVIGGQLCEKLANVVSLKLPEDLTAGALNLLHTSASTLEPGKKIGEITVKYEDHSTQIIAVISHIDCGNWRIPSPGKNACIARSTENLPSQNCLYVSSFELRQSRPREISFRVVDPNAIWMIAGVNTSETVVTFAEPELKEKDDYVTAGRDWLPLTFKRHTVRGSPLDFSWTNDSPSGKYGFIKSSSSGTLTFTNAPEKRIRLYGPNLCFSASFLSKETVDQLADTFVRNGYNTVRIHHHDTELIDPKAKDTLTFDLKKLDQLDYLFYVMKKNGIYIVTDLYTNRLFKSGDNIPECTFFGERQMKMLIPVSTAAMANWKEFARRWMTHKNPYTGLTWGEDPALFALNLINEEALTQHWGLTPESTALYWSKFNEWQKKLGLVVGISHFSDRIFMTFLQELQDKCLSEQLRFVKEELKLKTMVTSLNYTTSVPLTLMRNSFDLVDNHSYFDHPSSWRVPSRYQQSSAITRMAAVPRDIMSTRIFGKPFIVTEFNYCNPNMFRSEGGPMIGAYAGLQDWDALYRFAWSHSAVNINNITEASGFDAVNDPMAQLSDRIVIAMFLRYDIQAAKEKFAYRVSPQIFTGEDPLKYPSEFEMLGLIAQIGSVVDGITLPSGVTALIPANAIQPDCLTDKTVASAWKLALESKQAASRAGEILLNADQVYFIVKTPRTESITLKSGKLTADAMTVKNADSFQTVAAISLDGKALRNSGSILVIHLTNIANTKMLFGNEKKTILKNFGRLPLLVYRGKATVEFSTPAAFKVTALSADGDPLGEVKSEMNAHCFSFPIDPGCFPGGVMAYHLTR